MNENLPLNNALRIMHAFEYLNRDSFVRRKRDRFDGEFSYKETYCDEKIFLLEKRGYCHTNLNKIRDPFQSG